MPLDVAEDVFRGWQWSDAECLDAEAGHILQGVCLGEVTFGVREFVEACEEAFRRTFSDDDFSCVVNEEDRAVLDATCLLLRHDRVGGLLSAGVRGAEVPERTVRAEWCTVREADCRAEIHEGLVEAARGVKASLSCCTVVCIRSDRSCIRQRPALCLQAFICRRHPRRGAYALRHPAKIVFCSGLSCLFRLDVLRIGAEPGENAQEVSIHRRYLLSEGDGGDGRRGIRSDARNPEKLRIAARHLPAVHCHDFLRCLMHIPHAGIVAEPLPELHVNVLRGFCQCTDIRAAREKARIVTLYGIHPGLLQHDLGDPHVVRGRILTPREDPALRRIPLDQFLCHLFCCFHRFFIYPVHHEIVLSCPKSRRYPIAFRAPRAYSTGTASASIPNL